MRMVSVVALSTVLVLMGRTAAVAQEEAEEQINGVLDDMQKALSAADVDAFGKMLSDTVFVCTGRSGGAAVAAGKEAFLGFLRGALAGGVPMIAITDRDVSVHGMVALVAAAIDVGGEGQLQASMGLLRTAGKWKVGSLLVGMAADMVDRDEVKEAVLEAAGTLSAAFVSGTIDEFKEAINEDAVATFVVIPTGELYTSASKSALVAQVQSVLYTAMTDTSRLEDTEVAVYGDAATVYGVWVLQVPGEDLWRIRCLAHLVKSGGSWKLAAVAGGPE